MNDTQPITATQLGRRAIIVGGAVATAGVLASCSSTPAAAPPSRASPAVPFYGEHQPGVLADPAPAILMTSATVMVDTKKELEDLFRVLTERTTFLLHDTAPAMGGLGDVPVDSGTLGPSPQASGLTVTIGVGSSLFDERFGLAELKPAGLTPMETFPDDNLDPDWCHGDLSLVIGADSQDATLRALRDVTRHTRGGLQLNWKLDGSTAPPRPHGAPRNHFGFKDGTSNPDVTQPEEMRRLVWAADNEPEWTRGGSYQVIRLIRMLVEFWDRISMNEQELIFGRDRASGAPLTGTEENDIPDYPSDPAGKVIPLTSHIRLANPRDDSTNDSQILRRAYNYSRGVDTNGNLDMGLLFTCYQQNISRQFAAVQHRLDGEPLADYISPFGGGYFFALPGVRDKNDYFGRSLFS